MLERLRLRSNIKLLLPGLIIVVIFLIYPLINAVFISFRNWNMYFNVNKFNGIQNWINVFQDGLFWQSILRTFLYVIVVVLMNFIIGLGLALLADTDFKGSKLFIGIAIIPMLLIPAAGATLWRIMYLREFGLINHIRDFLGFGRFDLLSSTKTALIGVMIADIWSWTPWMFLILYGGIKALPKEPYEAAKIDGANFYQNLRYITLPLLTPVIMIALTLKSIDTFRTFDYVRIMTGGGPGVSSHVVTTYIYSTALNVLNYGYGSTMSLIVTIFAMLMAYGFIVILKKR